MPVRLSAIFAPFAKQASSSPFYRLPAGVAFNTAIKKHKEQWRWLLFQHAIVERVKKDGNPGTQSEENYICYIKPNE